MMKSSHIRREQKEPDNWDGWSAPSEADLGTSYWGEPLGQT